MKMMRVLWPLGLALVALTGGAKVNARIPLPLLRPIALPAPPGFVLDRWELEGSRLIDLDEAARILPWAPGDSIPADGVKHGKFKLFLGGIHIDQQVVNLVKNLVGPSVPSIYFIDDH